MNLPRLAHIISFISLPLWIPFFISLNVNHALGIVWASISCVLLLGIMLFYKNIGLLTSLQMPTRAERLLPLATSSLIYFIFAILSYFYVKSMYSVYVLAFLVVFILYIVNLWDKISIHVAGVTAGMLWLMRFYLWNVTIISLGIFLIFLVIWARLYLKAHTVNQILIGFLIGITSFLLLIFLL